MAAADDNQTVFGEEETAEFDAPTVVPDDNLTVVGHSAANPAGPARAPGRSSGSEPTFEIPMPAPTEMSDTLPPSSITWPPSIRRTTTRGHSSSTRNNRTYEPPNTGLGKPEPCA